MSAHPKPVNITPILEASREIKGSDFIYRQKIIARNATSIAITFDKLTLSKNAQIFLYNLEGTVVTGPITAKENIGFNHSNKQWSSNSFKGNTIILELKIPQEEVNQSDLHIGKIRFGLSKPLKENLYDSALYGAFNASSPCNRNISCPEGDAWQNERKAVCLIQTPTVFASGALINNTCNLLIPYVLTAWHVTNGDNPSNWVFIFNWWSSTCTPNTNTSQSLLFNGATLRSTYEPTDCSLIELNQTPTSNLNLSFLGWNRQNTIPTSTIGIHHPKGDQMKISFDSHPATLGNVRTNSNTAWRVLWTLGTSEEGSSGSPLFDQNHYVIGVAYAGTQPSYPPCNQQTGGNNYGRFDLSWTGGGTNATRLSNWLDPGNSGAVVTNTKMISALTPRSGPTLSISGAALFCTGSSTYTLSGAPAGSTITWSTSSPSTGSIPTPSNGTSVNVTAAGYAGNFTLTATVQFCSGVYTASKQIHIGGYSSSDYPVTGPSSASCNQTVYYSTNPLPGATSYTWFYPSGWNYSGGQGTQSLALQARGTTGNYQVGVRVANSCDAGGSYSVQNTYLSGCTFAPVFSVSPNPTTSLVTATAVTINSTGTSPKPPVTVKHLTITEINIYDQLGILRKHKVLGNVKSASVNVSDLATGIYIIEIVSDLYKERQKLEILK